MPREAVTLRKLPEAIALGRQAFRDDVGAAVAAITTEAFLGPGYAVSPLLSDTARRQFVSLPLQVLLATFDTNAAVDVRADLAGISIPTLVIQGDADQNNPLELTGRRPVSWRHRRWTGGEPDSASEPNRDEEGYAA